MHDINPLGTSMHLKELDRQAAPRLRSLPARRVRFSPATVTGTFVALLGAFMLATFS